MSLHLGLSIPQELYGFTLKPRGVWGGERVQLSLPLLSSTLIPALRAEWGGAWVSCNFSLRPAFLFLSAPREHAGTCIGGLECPPLRAQQLERAEC